MTKVTSGVLEHDREARRAFQVGTLRASCLWNGGQVLMIDNDIATLKHLAQGGMTNQPCPCRPRCVSRRNSFRIIS